MPVSIKLEGLCKNFETLKAVDSVDLTIEEGQLYALLGPSGCGKTTTLRMIAGLERPTAGRILIGGEDITNTPPYHRDLGLVFQNYSLFPHMNVEKNIAFGLRMRNTPRTEMAARVKDVLSLVQLSGLEKRRPSQLSGGQQQRVALARALVTRPRALLLDEPLSNLDKKLRDEMRIQLRDIQQRLGITAILVTHDQDEAFAMADQVVVMKEGRIEQIGNSESIYRRPANHFVAHFVGTANILEGRLTREGNISLPGGLEIPVSIRSTKGPKAYLLIRPTEVQIKTTETGEPYALRGTYEKSIYQGAIRRHMIALPTGERFIVDVTDHGGPVPQTGTEVVISFDPQNCHILPWENGDE